MTPLTETVLQFGAGRFLRAFADLFIHHANQSGNPVGTIVIVQSTGDDRASALSRQGGRYHVVIRGLEGGAQVDRVEPVESVSRALVASSQWNEVLTVACSPGLKLILSNTTETGYEVDERDRVPATDGQTPAANATGSPYSFPAKLLAVLRARWQARQPGLTIVPCELREGNADLLCGIVTQLAEQWRLDDAFRRWLTADCRWLNTLVDRIVTAPKDHPLGASDAMLTVCEPYALWALQQKPGAWEFLHNRHVVWTPDVLPYFLRKVRILNGGHTALLIKAWPRGFRTVREAVLDPELGAWLERLLIEEIVPVLEGRVDGPKEFARQTLERFKNPFLEHKLADIAVNHEAKVQVRLAPTRDEYREKFGKSPPLLDEVLALAAPV